MATIKKTVMVAVTREVEVDSMDIVEKRALIRTYCTTREIKKAIAEQLDPVDYLVALAVKRANLEQLNPFEI